jgi:DNA-binding transcriptional MerR regulator
MEGGDRLLTILQVSERLNIPKHTLRFWEKELNGLVVPLRTHGGQRRYTVENLVILEEIKRQRDNGCSLSEIVKKIRQNCEAETLHLNKIDLLANRVAEVVKVELYNFFKVGKDGG